MENASSKLESDIQYEIYKWNLRDPSAPELTNLDKREYLYDMLTRIRDHWLRVLGDTYPKP